MEKRLIQNLFSYNKWRFEIYWQKISENSKNNLDFLIKDYGLPFKSFKGTFSHLLLADYLWYMRITNSPSISVPFHNEMKFPKEKLKYSHLIKLWQDEGDFHGFYKENPYEWFSFHRERFNDMQTQYEELISKLDSSQLQEGKFIYRDSKGTEMSKAYSDVFYHLINHHTHHIGQASVAYGMEFGMKNFPETDYTYFLAEKEKEG